jgi:hypothetical protein
VLLQPIGDRPALDETGGYVRNRRQRWRVVPVQIIGYATSIGENLVMATHEIKLKFPAHEAVNSDITVSVKSDDTLLGRIEISRGSIDWWPANKSKVHYKMSWESFQKLMESNGRQVKK